MQKNKIIFLLMSLLFMDQAQASNKSLPVPDFSVGCAMGIGTITTYVGLFQVARGAYTFFTSSDASLTTKTLTDYEREELLSLPKEKLAKIIAREDERSKAIAGSFETFLNGMVWFAVAGASATYSKAYVIELATALEKNAA